LDDAAYTFGENVRRRNEFLSNEFVEECRKRLISGLHTADDCTGIHEQSSATEPLYGLSEEWRLRRSECRRRGGIGTPFCFDRASSFCHSRVLLRSLASAHHDLDLASLPLAQ